MNTLLILLALQGPLQSAPALTVRKALPETAPQAVRHAKKLRRFDSKQAMSALVCFKFRDAQAAQNYADAVSDPGSAQYRQWLTPPEIAERFGPTAPDYQAAIDYFTAGGLQVEETSPNRTTLRVGGSAAQMERAFGITLNQYQEAALDAKARGADAAPIAFFANAAPVTLPANLADKISGVEGLESWTRPVPLFKRRALMKGPYDPAQVRVAYDLAPIFNAGFQGQGRTIAISNYDGFSLANARRFISYFGLPTPAAGAATNVTAIKFASGSGAAGVGEGDLDIQMTLAMAPLANILVYDNGKPGNNNVPQNVVAVLAREVADNLADVLTESYAWPAADAAQVNSWHTQHVMMTMQGQTYCVASGDTGSIINYKYPYSDIDPEILSVGGTIVTLNADSTINKETGWSGSGGGYNAAPFDFNVLPAWQRGRGVPTGTNYRLVPDLALHSAGPDVVTGAYNFYYLQQFIGAANGTSFACPLVAASLLDIEQWLISKNALPPDANGKMRLGRINDRIYAFNGRSDLFHDIKTGSIAKDMSATPYWDYVTGWGTPDFANLAAALAAPLAVAVSPASASLASGESTALAAQVIGSNVTGVTWRIASGPGTVSTAGVYTAPDSIAAVQTVTVQAVSVIDTSNPGNTTAAFQPDPVYGTATISLLPPVNINGIVALEGIVDPALTVAPVHAVVFTLRPKDGGAALTFSQTLGAGGTFTLTGIPPKRYILAAKGDRWLQATVPVDATNGPITNVALFLRGGDANNDNSVDSSDFTALIGAFNGSLALPGSGYDPKADFNCDGFVDSSDFTVLIGNFGLTGE